jgi:hypothetical protein
MCSVRLVNCWFGLLQAEAFWHREPVFLQPAIDALETVLQCLPQRLPRTGELVRICTASHLHGCALYIPLQHQPISSGASAVFRSSSATSAQIGDLVAVVPRFLIPTSETSCPRINRGPSPSCQRNVRNTSPKSVRSRAASIRRLGA